MSGVEPVTGRLPDGRAYRVAVAQDPAARESCFAVRKEVFVLEQGVPQDLEYDELDLPGASTVHVLAVADDGTPLGTGRLLHGPEVLDRTGGELSAGSLGRLAVMPAARGGGVGMALVTAIERAAVAAGLTVVDLHAQTHALGFYERLGYTAYGPVFPDAGIEHRAMRKRVG